MDYVLETFWKHLKEILNTCYQEQINLIVHLEKVLKTSLQDVLKMSWRRLETSSRCLEGIFARRLEDVWPRRIYWSWSRRLEDVFWRRKAKANIFVLIKTSSEDEDERRLHQDECLLGWLLMRTCVSGLSKCLFESTNEIFIHRLHME